MVEMTAQEVILESLIVNKQNVPFMVAGQIGSMLDPVLNHVVEEVKRWNDIVTAQSHNLEDIIAMEKMKHGLIVMWKNVHHYFIYLVCLLCQESEVVAVVQVEGVEVEEEKEMVAVEVVE